MYFWRKSCTLVVISLRFVANHVLSLLFFETRVLFVENPVLSSLFVENNALLQKFMCSCSYALLFTSWCSILDPNLGQNLAQNWTPIWVHPKIHWKIESRKQVSFWNPNLCQNLAQIGTPNCPPEFAENIGIAKIGLPKRDPWVNPFGTTRAKFEGPNVLLSSKTPSRITRQPPRRDPKIAPSKVRSWGRWETYWLHQGSILGY